MLKAKAKPNKLYIWKNKWVKLCAWLGVVNGIWDLISVLREQFSVWVRFLCHSQLSLGHFESWRWVSSRLLWVIFCWPEGYHWSSLSCWLPPSLADINLSCKGDKLREQMHTGVQPQKMFLGLRWQIFASWWPLESLAALLPSLSLFTVGGLMGLG